MKIQLITLLLLFISIPPIQTSAQPVLEESSAEKSTNITIADLRYQHTFTTSSTPFLQNFREKSGLAFLSSALIPGTGQAINNKWIRAGGYLLAEAITLTVHFTSLHRARKQQRKYEQFANANWSVVEYAQWLVDYHDENGISNPELNELRNQVSGVSPAYDPDIDWDIVDLELLRQVERSTPFVYPDRVGNNFSHAMPNYGSQQYYELISKYYQYGPGWMDFGINRQGESINSHYQLIWDGSGMPPNFYRGSNLAEQFNNSYRLAGNMLSLIILNHIVSAFDAFLTVKLNNRRIETDANFLGPRSFILRYNF